MITPLMHVLSCYDEKFNIGGPLDILYLSRGDRDLIISEAKRLCSILQDEDKIMHLPSDTGLDMVCTTQSLANTAINISPFTALMLTRLKACNATYLREIDSVATEVVEDDLSTDAVVLRLEGNPRYVYYYVYTVMQIPALTYDAKISRLKELLLTVQNHTVVRNPADTPGEMSDRKKQFMSRLELHSRMEYWRGMLLSDYIRYYGVVPPEFNEATIKQVQKELWSLGFYGFVNPLAMYLEFNNSRISRKVEVNIEDWVSEFLTKIVLSGGATLE